MSSQDLQSKWIYGGVLLCLTLSHAGFVGGEVPTGGVEYKFRLVPEVVTAAKRDRLWTLLGGDSSLVSQKKCRLVQFLDVDGLKIQKVGFLLRHRAKFDTTTCPNTAPNPTKGDLTLKYRGDDFEEAARNTKEPWAKAGDHKFEQDVTLSEGDQVDVAADRAYSVSAKVEDVRAPKTMKGLREIFPRALGLLDDDAVLDVGCRRVLEERWVLELPDTGDGRAEIELAVWYRVSPAGKRSAEPMLAELSFKRSHDEVSNADELVGRLIRGLDASWLAAGGSKSAAALDCGE